MSLSYGSPGSGIDIHAPQAPQACLSCRKQKRKCSKTLPACALCERMGRPCDYSNASPAPTSEDFNALRQKVVELESRLNTNGSSLLGDSPYLPTPNSSTLSGTGESVGNHAGSVAYTPLDTTSHGAQNRFPAIAFLDSEAFKYGRILVPTPIIDIPMEVLEILGDASAVQVVISDYFDTIHTWMPIVSKKRLTRNMLNPMWEAGPDLALLFLSMKLVITRPQEGLESPHNAIYSAAKQLLSLMEASGMVSLMVLQAYILVAIYEMGQAIYPAAWMSVGASVRYALVLGINDQVSAPQLLPPMATWTESEERKRTWWGVIIIDRIVSIGSEGRFLACDDPSPDTQLPVDTITWDLGDIGTTPAGTLSNPASNRVCTFGRLCQASSLLGKVTRHHLKKGRQEAHIFREASEIYLEISALAQVLTKEAQEAPDYLLIAAPLAICFAALCNLCDPYACTGHRINVSNTVEESVMQVQAVEGLKTVSSSIKDFSEQIIARTPHSLDVDRLSPFIMDALYAAAANYAWLVRESGDEDCQAGLESMRHCLRRLGGRWRCASEMLRILEAQEFTYAIGGAGT